MLEVAFPAFAPLAQRPFRGPALEKNSTGSATRRRKKEPTRFPETDSVLSLSPFRQEPRKAAWVKAERPQGPRRIRRRQREPASYSEFYPFNPPIRKKTNNTLIDQRRPCRIISSHSAGNEIKLLPTRRPGRSLPGKSPTAIAPAGN